MEKPRVWIAPNCRIEFGVKPRKPAYDASWRCVEVDYEIHEAHEKFWIGFSFRVISVFRGKKFNLSRTLGSSAFG